MSKNVIHFLPTAHLTPPSLSWHKRALSMYIIFEYIIELGLERHAIVHFAVFVQDVAELLPGCHHAIV